MTADDRQTIEEWLMRQGPANCWTGTSGTLAAAVHRLVQERDRLVVFVWPRAYCPCCDRHDACDSECTFQIDDCRGFAEVEAARAALTGKGMK